jgi:hypothetical protein
MGGGRNSLLLAGLLRRQHFAGQLWELEPSLHLTFVLLSSIVRMMRLLPALPRRLYISTGVPAWRHVSVVLLASPEQLNSN